MADCRSDGRWRWQGPGVRQRDVLPPGGHGERAFLMKVAAGKVMPHHTHSAHEWTVVLHGSFSDELGRFAPGDFAELDENAHHRPAINPGADCICLVAMDGALRFSGFLGRLLQPLAHLKI